MDKKVLIALAAVIVLGVVIVYAATNMKTSTAGQQKIDNSERTRPY